MTFPIRNVISLEDDSIQARFFRQSRQLAAKIEDYFQENLCLLAADFIHDEPLYRKYREAEAQGWESSRFAPTEAEDPVAVIQRVLTEVCREQQRDFAWRITFHRTLRVPDDGNAYPLPAGLGKFPLRLIQSRSGHGLCLPMYSSEAMWMDFSTNLPCAVQIESGNVNVITGETGGGPRRRGEGQNYVVTGEQPWLDGFCVAHGIVRQFVAKPLGLGQTVGEQLSGEASGRLTFRLYPMKFDVYFREICLPRLPRRARDLAERLLKTFFELHAPAFRRASTVDESDMGLAAGGRIRQQIYRDPYASGTWEETPISFSIRLCHASDWTRLTGEPVPHRPIGVEEYAAAKVPWFDYYRDDLPSVSPAAEWGTVRSTADFEAETESGKPLESEMLVIGSGNAPRPDAESGIQPAVPELRRRQDAVEWWQLSSKEDPSPFSPAAQWTRLIGDGSVGETLASQWERFPVIPLSELSDGIAFWRRLRLNEAPLVVDGLRVDGFRFSRCACKVRYFVMAFEPPPNLFAWQLEVKGKREKFLDGQLASHDAGGAIVYQVAPAGQFGYEGENLVWFAFRDERAADLPLSLTFRDEPYDVNDPDRFQIVSALAWGRYELR